MLHPGKKYISYAMVLLTIPSNDDDDFDVDDTDTFDDDVVNDDDGDLDRDNDELDGNLEKEEQSKCIGEGVSTK